MQFPPQTKFPEIESDVFALNEEVVKQWYDLHKPDMNARLVIQEKIDGSNFTVYRADETTILFFNKGKLLNEEKQKMSVFYNTCQALKTRPDLFRIGYIYHGEAVRSSRPNHIMYKRIPKFYVIFYEILIPVPYSKFRFATPEEMTEILEETCLEQTHIYFDSVRVDDTSMGRLAKLFLDINTLHSCLGNYAEGFVVKLFSGEEKCKRIKYVSDHMKERKVIPGITASDYDIEAIGDLFNVHARFRKAAQHLEERGEKITRENIVDELDKDLLKEREAELKQILFNKYWHEIKRAARKDLSNFLKTFP